MQHFTSQRHVYGQYIAELFEYGIKDLQGALKTFRAVGVHPAPAKWVQCAHRSAIWFLTTELVVRTAGCLSVPLLFCMARVCHPPVRGKGVPLRTRFNLHASLNACHAE